MMRSATTTKPKHRYAEAIVVAAQRPEMRFVPPKSEEQQARAVLFRARERLLHQRTELSNALRAVLCEYGHAVPQGAVHLKRIVEILEAETCDLPELAREEARDLLEQIAEKTVRIEAKTRKIAAQAALTPTARRLQTMPPSCACKHALPGSGVGPMTALAVEAFVPAMATFKCGRDFAAWHGLVPRQMSSGGKERLGRISKAGQSDIRRLLIIGAPLMHVNMHCWAVDVAAELDGSQVHSPRVVARPAACSQAEDAGRHRTGQ